MEIMSSSESATMNGGVALPLEAIIIQESLYDEEKMKKLPKLLNSTAARSSCSIFRVPQPIMQLHLKSFQPEIVSIGPYHHGQEHLQMMEEHKWRILRTNLRRLKAYQVGLDQFFNAIAPTEADIRDCYSENIDQHDSHKLIEMMILDGCFIIEFLCVVEKIINPERHDPIFNLPWIFGSLTRDLLRLENQIPFFVLQNLYKLSISDFKRVPPLQELILGLCKHSLGRSMDASKEAESELRKKYRNNNGEHILDFYRSTFIPSSETEAPRSKNEVPFQLIQPVEKLREAGIKFEERKSTQTFLDIKFRENGVLEMPHLVTDDMMSLFILNCIAFEQCYKHRTMHFSSYVVFMSCLINTNVDAGHLRDQRIIENFFGTDKEVVKFFNEVGRDIAFVTEETYLSTVFKEVDNYYRNVWHVRLAEFKYKYCGSLWISLSASAALLVVLLTIIQAFFAAYAYFKPPH